MTVYSQVIASDDTGLSDVYGGTVTTQTTNYEFALADANSLVLLNSNSAISATVPSNAAIPLPIGTQISVMQYGTGVTSLVAGSGVTIRYISTLNIAAQYAVVSVLKIGTDEWVAYGLFQ